jgi:hypothetical protein
MTENVGGTEHFTPLFSNVVYSTLWTESDLVVKVFLTMLAKMGRDYVVKANSFNISLWANKTEEEVLKALKVLMSPDTKRVEKQEFEGRRVKKVDDGWLLLNGKKYDEKMRLMFERARKTRWARDNRVVGKGPVPVQRQDEGKPIEVAIADTMAERTMIAADYAKADVAAGVNF